MRDVRVSRSNDRWFKKKLKSRVLESLELSVEDVEDDLKTFCKQEICCAEVENKKNFELLPIMAIPFTVLGRRIPGS